jgi:predicted alpha-1,2-mannosidase
MKKKSLVEQYNTPACLPKHECMYEGMYDFISCNQAVIQSCSRIFLLHIFILSIFSFTISAQSKLVDYVNPFVGTDGHGHTFPGASVPFGMVQLSPDTDTQGWDWCSGYHYSDNSIMGFSHTHLSGTGVGDYGDILFMPVTGKLKTEPGSKDNPDSGYRSRFSHENEIAKPGYYSVFLDDYKIKTELTVTKRTGFHKYIFPKSEDAKILIDLVHGIQDKTLDTKINIIDNKTIEGYRRSTGWANDHCVYFYAEFSKPFNSFGVVDSGKIKNGLTEEQGKEIKAFVEFNTSEEEIIFVKVGVSHTSVDGARKNLKEEIPDWDFEKIKNQAEQEWENSLSAIDIKSSNKSNKTVFYTALYHALLAPNIFSDVDGSYIGMDDKVHSLSDRKMYTIFSLWDTFRAEHPLFTVIDPGRAEEMIEALISKYEEHGLLPVWELASNETGTMIGYHSIPVIADAYFKGLRNFDVEKAFKAMKKSAMQNHLGLKPYREMGYISSDLEHESVSKTLEYAYDDWCIAMMAKDLGKEEDYNYFIERSKFYTNLFDASTSLMRPKKNSKWVDPFDPYSVSGDYTEANAWQYSFFVPHDINGLIDLMGGDEKFISNLDNLFSTDSKLTGRHQPDITGLIGQYVQGNEPSHHMAYLYNYAGAPWKTQKWINEIVTTLYSDKPDGLPGNEDCGQMSAWYVFSSIGFYPVCPGDNNYIIGTPLFDKVTIKTNDEKDFTVVANNLSEKNFYIQSVKLNGSSYPYSYINHLDIMNGGELVFEMGPEPSEWGKDFKARPNSSVDIPFVPVPYLNSGERVFRGSQLVGLSSPENSSVIYYSIDGADPLKDKKIYSEPILIDKTTTLKAVSQNSKGINSRVITANFNKIPSDRSIKINSKYHHNYSAGGDLGLIDGIKGNSNFHTAWQGYEGEDFEAIVDLGEIQNLSRISASFLQNTGSWIFLPAQVEYYVSTDGMDYEKVFEFENIIDEKNRGEKIIDVEKKVDETKARYVKVFARNIGTCPPWHIGAGGKAWLFIDEITIE